MFWGERGGPSDIPSLRSPTSTPLLQNHRYRTVQREPLVGGGLSRRLTKVSRVNSMWNRPLFQGTGRSYGALIRVR